jgi:NADH-quinone oxidoreductase subunit L
LSVLGGLPGVPPEAGWLHHFLQPVIGAAEGEHGAGSGLIIALMLVATVIALAGWGLAYYFYILQPRVPDLLAARVPGLYTTLLNKYYVDELYDALFVEPTKRLGEAWD